MMTLKGIAKTLFASALAAMLVSCSIKNIDDETGVIVDSIDRQNLWTVVKAVSIDYSPYARTANGRADTAPSESRQPEQESPCEGVDAQNLTLQSGNMILEVHQPVFSDYGEVSVGDKGVVVYVRRNRAQGGASASGKKLYPRFVSAEALKRLSKR